MRKSVWVTLLKSSPVVRVLPTRYDDRRVQLYEERVARWTARWTLLPPRSTATQPAVHRPHDATRRERACAQHRPQCSALRRSGAAKPPRWTNSSNIRLRVINVSIDYNNSRAQSHAARHRADARLSGCGAWAQNCSRSQACRARGSSLFGPREGV